MEYWSNLCLDVLEEIAAKLCHTDLMNFGAVCQSWRSVYLNNLWRLPKDLPLALCHPRPIAAPILLLSCKPNTDSRGYVSLHDQTSEKKLFLPEAANKWICGSNWGWLVLVDIRGIEVCLYNPFTRSQIQLPSLDSFPILINGIGHPDDAPRDCFHFIAKAIISSDPASNPNNCVVMAIAGNIHRLCFCKLGDNRWTKVEGSPSTIEDVVYFDNKFYAIDQFGVMVSYDRKNPNAESQLVTLGPLLPLPTVPKRYLVVSEGNLLQLFRYKYSQYGNIFYDDEDDGDDGDDGDVGDDGDDGDDEDDEDVEDNDNEEENDNVDNNNVHGEEDEDEGKDGNCSYKVKTKTDKFDLFKLEKRDTPQKVRYVSENYRGSKEYYHKLTELESLNEHSIFIGYSGSLSIQAQSLPSCEGNHIYFTDDHHGNHICNLLASKVQVEAYHDIGIFDVNDKCVTTYHPNDPNDLLPAVWVTPNPW